VLFRGIWADFAVGNGTEERRAGAEGSCGKSANVRSFPLKNLENTFYPLFSAVLPAFLRRFTTFLA
jgi:hypothetical protein